MKSVEEFLTSKDIDLCQVVAYYFKSGMDEDITIDIEELMEEYASEVCAISNDSIKELIDAIEDVKPLLNIDSRKDMRLYEAIHNIKGKLNHEQD